MLYKKIQTTIHLMFDKHIDGPAFIGDYFLKIK